MLWCLGLLFHFLVVWFISFHSPCWKKRDWTNTWRHKLENEWAPVWNWRTIKEETQTHHVLVMMHRWITHKPSLVWLESILLSSYFLNTHSLTPFVSGMHRGWDDMQALRVRRSMGREKVRCRYIKVLKLKLEQLFC
jgi:hypothetical protein